LLPPLTGAVDDLLTPPSAGGGLLPALGDLLAPPSAGERLLAPLTRPASQLLAPASQAVTPPPTDGQPPAAAPLPTLLDSIASTPLRTLAGGPALPAVASGPFGGLVQLAAAAAAAALADSPKATPPAAGGAQLPPAPEPVPAAGGSGSAAGGSGVAFGLFLALLFSLAAFALQHYSRLRVPPARWRQFTFVAVIERPG
jgi:hypothetical protein